MKSLASMVAGPGKYIMGAAGVATIGMGITIWIMSGKIDRLSEWQDNIVSITSNAAGVTDKKGKPALLKKSDVAVQISLLGSANKRLERAIEKSNSESEERAKDFAESKASHERELGRLNRQAAQSQTRIHRLRDIAAKAASQPMPDQCPAVDDALLRELEGL